MLWMNVGVGIAVWLCIFFVIYFILRLFSAGKIISCTIAIIVTAAGVFLNETYFKSIYLQWQYENSIVEKYPLDNFAMVNTPQEMSEYMDRVREHIKKIKDPNVAIYYQSNLLSALFLKYGPQASDECLYHYLQTNTAYDKKLISIDPIYVLFNDFPDKFIHTQIDFTKLNTNEYLKQTFDAVEKVVKSGMEHPRPLPTTDETKTAMVIFHDVISNLSKKYSKKVVMAVLQNPNDPALDKQLSATIIIAFFEGMLAKGQADAALFMRVTLELNQNN